MARKSDESLMLGYGLKMAKMPRSSVRATRGCRRRRMHRPPTYDERCSQKTPRKKDRNESNISMKKYHHSPTLGVRSDSVSWMPYVEGRNSQDPMMRYDIWKSVNMTPATMRTLVPANRAAERTARSGSWRS